MPEAIVIHNGLTFQEMDYLTMLYGDNWKGHVLGKEPVREDCRIRFSQEMLDGKDIVFATYVPWLLGFLCKVWGSRVSKTPNIGNCFVLENGRLEVV